MVGVKCRRAHRNIERGKMEIWHTNEKFINQNKPSSRKYQQQWQQKYKDREAHDPDTKQHGKT